MATKSNTTVEATRRTPRTRDEWDALALETIVPMLQAGTTMTDIRAQFGAGPTIRRALTRVGFNTKGQSVKAVATSGSNPKVLAKRVAERRQSGAAWWRLELETGKSMDELKALLTKHGHESVVSGRVIHAERTLKRLAKAEAIKASVKPASKTRTRKPKVVETTEVTAS